MNDPNYRTTFVQKRGLCILCIFSYSRLWNPFALLFTNCLYEVNHQTYLVSTPFLQCANGALFLRTAQLLRIFTTPTDTDKRLELWWPWTVRYRLPLQIKNLPTPSQQVFSMITLWTGTGLLTDTSDYIYIEFLRRRVEIWNGTYVCTRTCKIKFRTQFSCFHCTLATP